MSGTAMNWDSPISNDGTGSGGILLPENSIAKFTVMKLEKGMSDKKKSPMAILSLKLANDFGSTTCLEHLVLHTDSEWKLAEFFRAIGQRKHGETFTPNWNNIEGTTGYCKVGVRKFKKKSDPAGEAGWTGTSNEIKAFLDPSDVPAQGVSYMPPAAPTAAPTPPATPTNPDPFKNASF